jgi:acetyltransferase-like isoleucine patch superfamily enzyme
MIRGNLVIEEGVSIGANLDTGYNVVLRKMCMIGNDVKIWSDCVIDEGAVIGNNVRIQCLCYVAQLCIVEDDVFLGPGVVLTNDKYPVRTDRNLWEPVIIRKGARIGANVTILPGVVIGERALIGAGAVVTKSVPAQEVWYGNPARRE